MRRFYFDIDNGEHHIRDHEGIDLRNVREARDEARRVLPQLVAEVLGKERYETVFLTVRNQSGRAIYTACCPAHGARSELVLD